jgi:hypothetical protein
MTTDTMPSAKGGNNDQVCHSGSGRDTYSAVVTAPMGA